MMVVICGTAGANGRWATTVGYDPQHVIVDPASAEAARLELQFPSRPRPRVSPAPARLALNNVSVDLSAALAAVTGAGRPSIPAATPIPHGPDSATPADSVSPTTREGVTEDGACGVADSTGLTVCVDAAGRLRPDDREKVRAFLVSPAIVYTADAASRTALAEVLDSVAPAQRDVIVREDAARAAPGRARIERRAP